jgi:membrane-associated phospholipid phosphatase
LFCGLAVFEEMGAPRAWKAILWAWMLAILYSTLATRQHVLADIVAGSLLGGGAYAFIFLMWRLYSRGKEFQTAAAGYTKSNLSEI